MMGYNFNEYIAMRWREAEGGKALMVSANWQWDQGWYFKEYDVGWVARIPPKQLEVTIYNEREQVLHKWAGAESIRVSWYYADWWVREMSGKENLSDNWPPPQETVKDFFGELDDLDFFEELDQLEGQ
jgi:hypothetical protein